MNNLMKSISIGFAVFLCISAGYQLRKYETNGMQDMYRKLLQHEQEVSAKCLDELDYCKEECN